MGETKVNLRHLLEDLRDGYPFPIEETILTELVANSLDSRASEIQFVADPHARTLSVIDNGEGMTGKELELYHDIASTTKERGKGIGFAGVGAKLALLSAVEITTETRKGHYHKATRWRLKSERHAPWEVIEPPGLMLPESGTAITIHFIHKSPLLEPDFINRQIRRHFYPIVSGEFMREILSDIYPEGMRFSVNGRAVELEEDEAAIDSRFFLIKLGKREKPVGMGFIIKTADGLPEEKMGLAISTYGKVIKRGWDWIGVSPRNPSRLTGIVEIPELSKILMTNKADFLGDSASLAQKYRYRKAIQEALRPVLRDFGEITSPPERLGKDLRPFEKELEKVLENMLNDFPELNPLMGKRPAEAVAKIRSEPGAPPAGTPEVLSPDNPAGGNGGGGAEGDLGGSRENKIEPSEEKTAGGRLYGGRKRHSGLMIAFDEKPEREELGWLIEGTLVINEGHPAFKKVKGGDAENYHVMLSSGLVLSGFLEEGRSPQKFVNRFLSSWSRQGAK